MNHHKHLVYWYIAIAGLSLSIFTGGIVSADAPPEESKKSTTTKADSKDKGKEKKKEKEKEKEKPKTIPLSFKDQPMDKIANFLMKNLGKTVFTDPKVKGKKISLVSPKPLPMKEAMYQLTMAMLEVGVVIDEGKTVIHLIPIEQVIAKGNLRVITAKEDVAALDLPGTLIVRKFFAIKHYDAIKLATAIEPLKPSWGQMMADEVSRQLIVVATIDRLRQMALIINELDQPKVTASKLRIFKIQHADVFEIITVLEELISNMGLEVKVIMMPDVSKQGRRGGRPRPSRPGRSSKKKSPAKGVVIIEAEEQPVLIIPDPRQSSIIVEGPPVVLDRIEAWLKKIDIEKPEHTDHEVYKVKFVAADELADQLSNLLRNMPDVALASSIRIVPIPATDRLVIIGSKANRKMVLKWLEQIDSAETGQVSKTFQIEHIDATELAEDLKEFFQEMRQSRRWPYRAERTEGVGRNKVKIRANARRNTITVMTSREKMIDIEKKIKALDKRFEGKEADPLIITLRYADPEKTKELLESLFTRQRRGRSWLDIYFPQPETPAIGRLFGQFRFEAIPETGKLVVITKNVENYAVIERLIAELDKPQEVWPPLVIELKYADAETLAEQLNALLNAPGTPTSILRRGLLGSFKGFSELISPYNPEMVNRQPQQSDQDGSFQKMEFWWQRSARTGDEKQPSNMIGRLRIVPNIEQNSLMVAAPEEYAKAIEAFVAELDKPRYQVLIKATIMEITHNDDTSLGFRFSTNPGEFISGDPLITENALRGLINYTFEDTFGQQHTFSLNVDANNLISMLRKVTDVKIKSQPKIFAADNIEAAFFDGQDVPFIAKTITSAEGASTTQDFKYFPVGIRLRIRPHITKERNIDLTVNLIVSDLVPGATLFGGAIVNRRETGTRIILEDGQTFMISGILREQENEVIRRVPGLGDIPLLGELFKHREITKINSELIILLTPYVIGPKNDDADIEVERQKRIKEHLIPNDDLSYPSTRPAGSARKG